MIQFSAVTFLIRFHSFILNGKDALAKIISFSLRSNSFFFSLQQYGHCQQHSVGGRDHEGWHVLTEGLRTVCKMMADFTVRWRVDAQ